VLALSPSQSASSRQPLIAAVVVEAAAASAVIEAVVVDVAVALFAVERAIARLKAASRGLCGGETSKRQTYSRRSMALLTIQTLIPKHRSAALSLTVRSPA
jgi:hypothetical protein